MPFNAREARLIILVIMHAAKHHRCNNESAAAPQNKVEFSACNAAGNRCVPPHRFNKSARISEDGFKNPLYLKALFEFRAHVHVPLPAGRTNHRKHVSVLPTSSLDRMPAVFKAAILLSSRATWRALRGLIEEAQKTQKKFSLAMKKFAALAR